MQEGVGALGRGSSLKGGRLSAGPFWGEAAAAVIRTHAHWLWFVSRSRLFSEFPSPFGSAYFELLKELPSHSSMRASAGQRGVPTDQSEWRGVRGANQGQRKLEPLTEFWLLCWLAFPLHPRVCSFVGPWLASVALVCH